MLILRYSSARPDGNLSDSRLINPMGDFAMKRFVSVLVLCCALMGGLLAMATALTVDAAAAPGDSAVARDKTKEACPPDC